MITNLPFQITIIESISTLHTIENNMKEKIVVSCYENKATVKTNTLLQYENSFHT